MALASVTCPDDCESLALPVVTSNDCAPETEFSEIIEIFFALDTSEPFTDVEDPEEWADRLSQTATPPVSSGTAVKDLVRRLLISGDVPAATPVVQDLSGGRFQRQIANDYVLNVDVDDANDDNFKLSLATQCGPLYVRAWFKSYGNKLYGGDEGIMNIDGKGAVLLLNPIFARGSDSIVKLTGTLKWRSKTFPARSISVV